MYLELKEQAYRVVDAFCDEHISEAAIKQWCASRGIPRGKYDAFYESELGRYCLPPQLGGYDGPFLIRALVTSRLARRAGAVLSYVTDMNSMALLSTMRSLSQQEIVEDLGRRNGCVAFSQAFSEGSDQTDSSSIVTQVTADDGGLYLDGVKTYVADGQFSPETLVLTQDLVCGAADGGMSLWMIPISSEGISTYPLNTAGQEMLALARIEFDHVKLDPVWQIQTEGCLRSMLDRQYELGRILTCATSWGLAAAALDDALERCCSHRVGGRYLGAIPQVETLLANMAAKVRTMEAFVMRAAESVSDGSPLEEQKYQCSIMKHYVPKAATEVASDALQIFGGAGYTDSTRVSRIWRDCRGNQIAQGADEMMTHPVAKSLLGNYTSALRDY